MTLRCRALTKTFVTRNGRVSALADVTFSAQEGEFLCIVGPSGCGKTTLLRLIAGLAKPTSGTVEFTESRNGRPGPAMVFQEHGLFPWMSVLDNVAFGLTMRGVDRAERRRRALRFVEQMGLAAFAHSYPHELSVGMSQRVGIARAFLTNPDILLMDEPLGSLDAQTKHVLREELLRIWQEHRKLVVYITHDIEEAVLLADRILVMTGRPAQIREEIQVTLDRPRDLLGPQGGSLREISQRIWRMLEEEVRMGLGVRP
jgi:NitT/TauT family transport system ATP-binding protein